MRSITRHAGSVRSARRADRSPRRPRSRGRRPPAEQAVGEPAGRGAGVEAVAARARRRANRSSAARASRPRARRTAAPAPRAPRARRRPPSWRPSSPARPPRSRARRRTASCASARLAARPRRTSSASRRRRVTAGQSASLGRSSGRLRGRGRLRAAGLAVVASPSSCGWSSSWPGGRRPAARGRHARRALELADALLQGVELGLRRQAHRCSSGLASRGVTRPQIRSRLCWDHSMRSAAALGDLLLRRPGLGQVLRELAGPWRA